jgi:uncharacterized coiled-coil DUF342 family protein
MQENLRIGEALVRFEAALDKVEAAMLRYRELEDEVYRLSGETAALRTDRSTLAEELDEVRAKAGELAEARREAAKRVDNAMHRIRNVAGLSSSLSLETSDGS